ncbi:MAG: ferrous iron transport protein A [Planctomycetota bacterium]|nr:MAG: ferrous iron transport protein A [Planctomycetota bacterium]
MTDDSLKPLSKIEAGRTVKLISIDAGIGLKQHLAAMGILQNAEITVVRNWHCGRIIINVKNTKVVLGRGMAHKIMVR